MVWEESFVALNLLLFNELMKWKRKIFIHTYFAIEMEKNLPSALILCKFFILVSSTKENVSEMNSFNQLFLGRKLLIPTLNENIWLQLRYNLSMQKARNFCYSKKKNLEKRSTKRK